MTLFWGKRSGSQKTKPPFVSDLFQHLSAATTLDWYGLTYDGQGNYAVSDEYPIRTFWQAWSKAPSEHEWPTLFLRHRATFEAKVYALFALKYLSQKHFKQLAEKLLRENPKIRIRMTPKSTTHIPFSEILTQLKNPSFKKNFQKTKKLFFGRFGIENAQRPISLPKQHRLISIFKSSSLF